MDTIYNGEALPSETKTKHNPRRLWLVLGILILASAAAGILRFNSFQVGGYSDDAHYLVLAESLASSQGYLLINFPQPQPEWAFPPGWPLLLSPLMALFPGRYEAAKYLSFFLWLASIPLMYRLFVRRIKTPYLEILLALIVLNPSILGMASMVTSEVAYVFFSLLTLCLFELSEDRRRTWLLVVAFALTAIYTTLIRTVGISLQLSLVTCLLFMRRFRQAAVVALIFILGLLPQLWLNLQSGGSLISPGYQRQGFNSPVGTMLEHVWENAQGYAEYLLANLLVPVLGSNSRVSLEQLGLGFVPMLFNAAILLLIAVGFFLAIRQFRISEMYIIFYFAGILVFWIPNYGGVQSRFLVPVIPFLYFYLFLGLLWCARKLVRSERLTSWMIVGSTALVLLLLMARNLQDWRNPIRDRMTDLTIGRGWVAENAPSDALVMSRNPVADYLYVRRKTLAYPAQLVDVEEFIRTNGVDYIIISPKLQIPRRNELDEYVETSILPVLTMNPDMFKPVYTNPDHNVTVYEYLGNR